MKFYILSLSLLVVPAIYADQAVPKKITNPPAKQGALPTMKRVTLPSGLAYEIMTESSQSQTPTKGKVVTVHYTGWLADEEGNPRMDKKFDSSVDRGTPFQFVIGCGQVIKGWDEGVLGMKVGEKRRLIIPASLAYGARGAGNLIPGNSTLVFDVELLKVS